jgi:predicted MFS family arabinose efflux permease
VTALAFAAFLLFGVMLVLVGANQAELARDLELDLAGSGLLVSLLSVGLGVGVLGAGPLVDRLPRRPLFVGA